MHIFFCMQKEQGGMRESKYESNEEEKENKGNK